MKKFVLNILAGLIITLSQSVLADKSHEDAIKAFSQKVEVVTAMKEFSETFGQFRADNGLESVDALKKSVFAFYDKDFADEYKNTGGKAPDLTTAKSIDDDATAFQHYYIVKNTAKVGEKNHFIDAKDKSKWNAAHVKHHELIEKFTHDENGFYDLFLIDLSGRIVYSVFKEIDFATRLVDGPYANTGLGAIFKDTKDIAKGEAKTGENAPYFPSYEDNAQFIGTPIFDGDNKVGVLVIQLPSW
ncbi:hypothetical protein QUF74_02110 [Candidatus Halobeggiatoa sp. HSG11]|nr:hypothetical protein [Candidatus Halobeggiatoa sp. HSG11]